MILQIYSKWQTDVVTKVKILCNRNTYVIIWSKLYMVKSLWTPNPYADLSQIIATKFKATNFIYWLCRL